MLSGEYPAQHSSDQTEFPSNAMALSATVYVLTVRLADADRNVYETLTLRMARHPSESAEYLLSRALAYCLEYTAGITFSKGLSVPDEPAILVRDLVGSMQCWIEIGTPEAARLHKASKAVPRVIVYVHRDLENWLTRLSEAHIHRAEALEIVALDDELLAAMCSRLERRMEFDLSVSEGSLYLTIGGETFSGVLSPRRLAH
jgi:uncharacterized protein YaeQ